MDSTELPAGWENLAAFVRFHGPNTKPRDILNGDFCQTCVVAIRANAENIDLRKP